MTLIDDIRKSIKDYDVTAVFNYGRRYDTALAAYELRVDQWFIHLDPVTFTGVVPENTEAASVYIGFLKQDKPDSEYDKTQELDITLSIEEIQEQAKNYALSWLNYFLDNYQYGGTAWTCLPVTRIKQVMSGIGLQVTFNYKTPC